MSLEVHVESPSCAVLSCPYCPDLPRVSWDVLIERLGGCRKAHSHDGSIEGETEWLEPWSGGQHVAVAMTCCDQQVVEAAAGANLGVATLGLRGQSSLQGLPESACFNLLHLGAFAPLA